MTRSNEFYGFELAPEAILEGMNAVDDYFYLKDVGKRNLFIMREIDDLSATEVIQHIIRYNIEDKDVEPENRKPIKIFISSVGGSVDFGYSIIDAIRTSVTPVYTINLGMGYSMASIILMSGHKRYSMPNAKILVHDGSTFVSDSLGKARDYMNFCDKVCSREVELITSLTKITEEEYKSNMRVEWYMFADEAKEKGIVDYIIGTDCMLYDLI